MNLKTLQGKMIEKVQAEYTLGFNHVRAERERKRGIMNKVLNTSLPE
jgi:hypothetical protein